MMSEAGGRLSTLRAALVVMRRDFTAILFSRSFIFFLLGPMLLVLTVAMAATVASHSEPGPDRTLIGIAMPGRDTEAMLAAQRVLAAQAGADLPDFTVVRRLKPGEDFDAAAALRRPGATYAAILSGSAAHPVLTGAKAGIDGWRGAISLIAAQASGEGIRSFPAVRLQASATPRAALHSGRTDTAKAGQTTLFFLTMMLAGMVLSNLVEEKGNKIIEVLAAAIPLEALFLGKLFAMLAMSLVAICLWGAAGEAIYLAAGKGLPMLAAPAVGWPMFIALGALYFSMAYLLLGSVFLAIGSMAATVRDVQTLSMPVTMLQLVLFFFASYAMTRPGSMVELAAVIIPFSSPFAMLARAAVSASLWPHVLALAWQALAVLVCVRLGSALFRQRVMKSGPASGRRRQGARGKALA
ncbi:MAG: ABC transporter permease [Sphingomonadales bacterium]|nr:ABC transporter permease [Sphingomonadales bacterium]